MKIYINKSRDFWSDEDAIYTYLGVMAFSHLYPTEILIIIFKLRINIKIGKKYD